MPIVVRHDVDPGMIPFEASYLELIDQIRQRQAGGQARQQASAEATNARMRADRAALGEKQYLRKIGRIAPDPSTQAGFNWQQPIQVHQGQDEQGRHLTQTVYENMGPDPMAAAAGVEGAHPGFGALGTRESHIIDSAKSINPNDPEDLAKLSHLQRARPASGTIQLDQDFFRSKREIDERNADQETWKQILADRNKRTSDAYEHDRRQMLEERQRQDRETRELTQKKFDERQKLEAEIGGYQHGIEAERGNHYENTKEDDFHFTAAQLAERKQLFKAADDLEGTPVASEKEARDKARALKMIHDKISAMKPREPIKRQYETFTDAQGNRWKRDRITGDEQLILKAEKEKEQVEKQLSDSFLKSLIDDISGQRDPLSNQPLYKSEQEVLDEARRRIKVIQSLKSAELPIAPPGEFVSRTPQPFAAPAEQAHDSPTQQAWQSLPPEQQAHVANKVAALKAEMQTALSRGDTARVDEIRMEAARLLQGGR